MASRRAGDRHGIEVRGLDEHIGGVRADFGIAAAHDARESDGPRIVGDDEIFEVKCSGAVVEGDKRLPRMRPAHSHATGQLAEVVSMNWLTELEHDVVGDVDDKRDRTNAGECEPRDHPRRCRAARVDAAHDAGHENARSHTAADGHVIPHLDEEAGGRDSEQFGELWRLGGITKRRSGGVRVLTRDAAHGKRVAAVGSHVDLDGGVVETQEGDGIRSGLRI